MTILLLTVMFAPFAASEPVESGTAVGAGWTVTAGGILRAELVAEAAATIPDPCPAAPARCADSESAQLVGARVGSALNPTVEGSLLLSEAAADKAGGITAVLQDEMDDASDVTLTSDDWNTRGYNRVQGFSALGGAIRADLLEAEAVSGTRLDGGTLVNAVATGASVERLRLAGILGSESLNAIVPGEVNQELLNVNVPLLGGNVRIVFWETNWNPATASAPAGESVWVNTLHITAPGIDIIVAHAEATSTFVAPPPDNDPPNAVNDSATTTPTSPVLIDVAANDDDGDENDLDRSSVEVVDGQGPSNGTVECHTTGDDVGKCTYTPNGGFTGQDSFTYRICDIQGACDTATVTITVAAAAPANNPPAPDDDAASTPRGTPVDIEVLDGDTDPDPGDSLRPESVRVVSGPANGSASCDDDGICTYAPNAGFTGDDTFTYEVCDQAWACETATVTITVTPPTVVNQPPNAVNDDADTDPGVPVDIEVLVNDDDGTEDDLDPSTLELVAGQGPENGGVTCYDSGPNIGTCTYEPNPGFVGQDSFMYRVCDTGGLCDTALVTITVAPPPPPGNRPPDAVDDSTSTPRNTPRTIDVMINDSDPDPGDSLRPSSVRVVTDAANGTAVCDNGSCTYTPTTGFAGTDTFTYEVCDQAWECAIATVTITVIAPPPPPTPPVNQPPTAADDTASTTPGTPVVIDVTDNDTDPENDLDESTLTITDPPSNGDVVCSNGSCTYTPDDGFTGTDELTYEICDGTGRCDSATVVIIVQPEIPGSAPPVALDDAASTRRGTPVPIAVTQNDSDPDGDLDTSSVRVIQPPRNGTVLCVGSLCTYTPDAGFTGSDSFIYEVCDAAGACDTAVVTILVRDRNGNDNGGGGDGPGGDGPGGDGPGGDGPGGDGPGGDGPGGDGPDGNDGGSSNGPDFGADPSGPNMGDGSGAPLAAPIPIPSLGAPGTSLPLTGGTPAGYLTLALYAIATGMLVLWKCRAGTPSASGNVMQLLSAAPPARALPELDRNDGALSTAVISTTPDPVTTAPDPVTPPTEADASKAEKAAVIKPAVRPTATANKPATKTAAKKPARKSGAKKSTAKKSTARSATTAKGAKSTAAVSTTKKASTRKKAPVRKASAPAATVAAPRKRATSTKKSTVKKKTQSRKATEKERS